MVEGIQRKESKGECYDKRNAVIAWRILKPYVLKVDFYAVCSEKVGHNSICYRKCQKLVHRCSLQIVVPARVYANVYLAVHPLLK